MRFRLGLVVGGAIGYVLGARAGRERYEQIKKVAGEARKHPAMTQINDQVTAVADLARNTVARGLEEGSKGIRKMAEQQPKDSTTATAG